MYSITMKGCFWSSNSMPNIRAMFGWSRCAAARASRSNRRRVSASAAAPASINLRATVRPLRVSSALSTSPMPPRPSTRETL
jgi:hypothetical protein